MFLQKEVIAQSGVQILHHRAGSRRLLHRCLNGFVELIELSREFLLEAIPGLPVSIGGGPFTEQQTHLSHQMERYFQLLSHLSELVVEYLSKPQTIVPLILLSFTQNMHLLAATPFSKLKFCHNEIIDLMTRNSSKSLSW